ncbi:MAG TPA: ABC transporter substrate-binding protein, partial [Stellaceae bacterium]
MSMLSSLSRRGFVAVSLLLALPLAAQRAGAATPDAAGFIGDLGGRVLQLLDDKQRPLAERGRDFAQLAEEAFDFPRIARFTLGRYWRTASDEQKQQYEAAFQAYMVKYYWS